MKSTFSSLDDVYEKKNWKFVRKKGHCKKGSAWKKGTEKQFSKKGFQIVRHVGAVLTSLNVDVKSFLTKSHKMTLSIHV